MPCEGEKELLARCRRGEPGAWDELFSQHYAAAARFVMQLSHAFTWEDAEEICQETLLSVIRNLPGFNGKSQFQTWLFRIAANKARDFRQRQSAAKRGGGTAPLSLQEEDPETGLKLEIESTASGPDTLLIAREQDAQLRLALDQLGEPCREILELRYLGDLSYEEISTTLDMNPKTVSSRLSKCLDQLEELGRHLFTGGKSDPFPSNKL